MPVLYLTETDVRQVLTMDVALPVVESALRKISLDEAVNNPRQRCQTDQVMLHVLPAAAKTMNAIGYKSYTTGKFDAQFQVTLFDPKFGGMIAILQADYLGQIRTGAASGVATKKLARQDSTTLGLFGTGKQARTQLLAVSKVRKLTKVYVYSRDADRRMAFAAEMSSECHVDVIAVATPQEAAQNLDIICTVTASREPVLLGEWVAPGTHLNIAGSNFLAKAEVDAEVFRRTSLITVDSKEQARTEAGDFVAAMNEHVFTWSDVVELPHVLVGRYPGRASPQDVTLFKSLGIGIEDVAIAAKVYELAKERGIGRELDI